MATSYRWTQVRVIMLTVTKDPSGQDTLELEKDYLDFPSRSAQKTFSLPPVGVLSGPSKHKYFLQRKEVQDPRGHFGWVVGSGLALDQWESSQRTTMLGSWAAKWCWRSQGSRAAEARARSPKS